MNIKMMVITQKDKKHLILGIIIKRESFYLDIKNIC